MTNRRTFVRAGAACLGLRSLGAAAQTSLPRRIGWVGNASPATASAQRGALQQGLRELGWIEGQNLVIDFRWADGNPDRLAPLIDELVRARIEVILVSGTPAIRAVQKATRTIPVVFVLLSNPVALGLVPSLARPGGNLTGLASQFEELITKQMQLLKEAVPSLSRVALLRDVDSAQAVVVAAEAAARSLGIVTQTLAVAGEAEFEGAFKAARSARADAIHVLPSPFLGARRARLIELAARYRLPAFYELRFFVQDGGLMSYGPNIDDLWRRSASYVDRILKGARPGDLAIERASRFELVINRKTAAALGLALPRSFLQRADEVIG
jgi:putative ABC transport system substrate-binding protein